VTPPSRAISSRARSPNLPSSRLSTCRYDRFHRHPAANRRRNSDRNEFRMAPKAHATWSERACLWGGIIGYVGDGKTPSFNPAFTAIWALQAKFRGQFQEAFEAYESKARTAKMVDKQWQQEVAKALAKGATARGDRTARKRRNSRYRISLQPTM
jgi:hypothetical protein